MGTWGSGVFDDDLAVDVRSEFETLTLAGSSPAAAAEAIINSKHLILRDPDEGPVVYLAVSELLLQYGVTAHFVLDETLKLIRTNAGLERWMEQDSSALEERKAVYFDLGKRIEKPARRQRHIEVSRPRVGDIIEIPLATGRYAYAQYVFFDKSNGPLILVFDQIAEQPLGVDDLAVAGPMFPPVIVGINPPVRAHRWRIIGNRPVVGFQYPLFRAGHADQTGKVSEWWIWDGVRDRRIGRELPLEYRTLEFQIVWPAEWLEERIMHGGSHPFIDRIH